MLGLAVLGEAKLVASCLRAPKGPGGDRLCLVSGAPFLHVNSSCWERVLFSFSAQVNSQGLPGVRFRFCVPWCVSLSCFPLMALRVTNDLWTEAASSGSAALNECYDQAW